MAGGAERQSEDVAVDMLPEGRWTSGMGGVDNRGQGGARGGDVSEVGGLVAALDRTLSAVRRLTKVWQESQAEAALPQTKLPGSNEQDVREHDAVNIYFCTIQAANQETLREVLFNGHLLHTCPTSDVRIAIRVADPKSRRCPCSNPNCYVYQYTQPDKTPTEHKGG